MKRVIILLLIGMSLSVYGQSQFPDSQGMLTDMKIPKIVEKSPVKKKEDIKLKILAYGSLGETSVTNNIPLNTKRNYSLGSQIFYLQRFGGFLDIAIGLDLGYSQFYNFNAIDINQKDQYVHSLLVSETTFWLAKWLGLSFQLGVGGFWGIETTSRLGVMLGLGYEFRVHPQIVIPIKVRMDAISFSDRTISSTSIMTGIAFYFDL